jgi:hypothetical protein
MGEGAYREGVSLHIKATVFWNVTPCSLAYIMTFQRTSGFHYEDIISLMINKAGSYETSVGR